MQKDSPIYAFLDPIDYLNFEFKRRKHQDPRFTLRKWSTLLGYKNPSFLAHILKRERKLKIDLASRVAEVFSLNPKEKNYLELIVLKNNSKSTSEQDLYFKLIRKVRPRQYWDLDNIPVHEFEFASEWYHWVILELFFLKDFFPSVDYIQNKLGPTVSKKMIQYSLDKLTEIGLIEKRTDGTFARSTNDPLFLKDIPSHYIREYHKNMAERSKSAIDEVSPAERYIRGSMIALTKEQLKEAAQIIEDAHRKILALSADEGADRVYHFSSHLFPLTVESERVMQ
jgi:uncharacterized protein (TIGR02147 family)